MNILLNHKNFEVGRGGIETFLYKISSEFIKKGHKVTILTCDEGRLKKKEGIRRIKILRYPMPIMPKGFIWSWPIIHIKKIKEYYKRNFMENDFDLVLCGYPIFVKPSLDYFKKSKVIYIAPSVHAVFAKLLGKDKDIFSNIKKKMTLYTILSIENSIMKKVKIITLSKCVKNQIVKVFNINPSKIKVISPGISLDKFRPSKNKKDIVLYVGRLTEEKNIISLIRAFRNTSKGKLVIVGGGIDFDNLKKEIKKDKRIILTGWKKDPSMYFSSSKIFVLPSIYEGFGLVLLEAMASGLPCIAFKPDGKNIITASNEIINQGKTGFLVKNEKEMVEKIDLLLKNNKLREKMGKAARKEAKKYSWKQCAEEILNTAKEVE